MEKYIPASEDEESRWEADGDYDDLDIEKVYVGRVSILGNVYLIGPVSLMSLVAVLRSLSWSEAISVRLPE